ncbi:MAG: hypothetical protein ACKO22_10295 [Cyanobium sp.]
MEPPLRQLAATRRRSLAGRAAVLQLEGLAVAEIRAVLPDLGASELLLRGGCPELYANRAIDPADYSASHGATYLERDLLSNDDVFAAIS